jgi:hypothetical protein
MTSRALAAGRARAIRPKEPISIAGRGREEVTIADGTGVAATEAATFTKIAAAETAKKLFPTIPNAGLSDVAVGLSRLPRPLNPDELAARRGLSDRGPWEAAFDALSQFSLSPGDVRFFSVLDDARQRIRRSAGDLAGGFDAFLRAAEIAVAMANRETLSRPRPGHNRPTSPSPTTCAPRSGRGII